MTRLVMPKTSKGVQVEIKRVKVKIDSLLNQMRASDQKLYGRSPPNLAYIDWKPESKKLHKDFMYHVRRQKRLYDVLYPKPTGLPKRIRRRK